MNSTFKVVFNKARGALMVVNEVTSSVQGKGTKTVVAAAVAAMIAGVSGSAMATETDTEIKATDTALKATFTKAEKQTDVASSLIGTSGDKLALKNVTNKDMYAAGSLDLTASNKDNVVRECQDCCVWGGYSRGSPTRLPFPFCDVVCQT